VKGRIWSLNSLRKNGSGRFSNFMSSWIGWFSIQSSNDKWRCDEPFRWTTKGDMTPHSWTAISTINALRCGWRSCHSFIPASAKPPDLGPQLWALCVGRGHNDARVKCTMLIAEAQSRAAWPIRDSDAVIRSIRPPSDASVETAIILVQCAQDDDARRVSSFGLCCHMLSWC